MGTLGDFYNYLTIESYVLSDSDYGDDDIYTWTTFSNCWAEIVTEAASESIANNQVYNRDVKIWKVRFDSNITENMRIYFDGEYYDITGIELVGRRKHLILRTHRWNS